MDRLTNYVFLILLAVLFVLEAGTDDKVRIFAAFVISILFCMAAFFLRLLTLDGAVAAAICGTYAFGFGGYSFAVLLLAFFITASLLSGKAIIYVEETTHEYAEKIRRDGVQVWANGFWFIFFLVLWFISGQVFYLAGSVGALAVATSDTWATELGSKRFPVKTYLLSGFEKVEAGTDGGVSITGTLGGLGGSLLIAGLAVLLFPLGGLTGFTGIFLAGFSGCVLDSYLGATFQRRRKMLRLPPFFEKNYIKADNNFVNWAATGAGSLLAIILNTMLL